MSTIIAQRSRTSIEQEVPRPLSPARCGRRAHGAARASVVGLGQSPGPLLLFSRPRRQSLGIFSVASVLQTQFWPLTAGHYPVPVGRWHQWAAGEFVFVFVPFAGLGVAPPDPPSLVLFLLDLRGSPKLGIALDKGLKLLTISRMLH